MRFRGAAIGLAMVLALVLGGCGKAGETGAVPLSSGPSGAGEPAADPGSAAGTARPPRSAPTLSWTPPPSSPAKTFLQRKADEKLKKEAQSLKHRAYFTMPNLVGRNLQGAQDTLQALDSYLLNEQDATGRGRSQILDRDWRVCTQIPKPGTKQVSVIRVVVLGAVKLSERCPR